MLLQPSPDTKLLTLLHAASSIHLGKELRLLSLTYLVSHKLRMHLMLIQAPPLRRG